MKAEAPKGSRSGLSEEVPRLLGEAPKGRLQLNAEAPKGSRSGLSEEVPPTAVMLYSVQYLVQCTVGKKNRRQGGC